MNGIALPVTARVRLLHVTAVFSRSIRGAACVGTSFLSVCAAAHTRHDTRRLRHFKARSRGRATVTAPRLQNRPAFPDGSSVPIDHSPPARLPAAFRNRRSAFRLWEPDSCGPPA